MMELVRHSYRYFPYELELARREVETLLPDCSLSISALGYKVDRNLERRTAERFVYFAQARSEKVTIPTMQAMLERVNGTGINRQSTRYSAHGLHEYKGKFNPQIVRAILNILGIPAGSNVIDPFCGSGTALLECAHLGMYARGTDINPLAVFIANAKLLAVRTPAAALAQGLDSVLRRFKRTKAPKPEKNSERNEYLLSWFETDIFFDIERLRITIEAEASNIRAPLLAIASNCLREYSLQDPNDLRIRRRKTPLPKTPFIDSFAEAAQQFLKKIEDAQSVVGRISRGSKAVLADSRELKPTTINASMGKFDCAVTSPPYATALPYIDTQRLSLVWLGLIPPSEILSLEAKLVGSREVRGQSKKSLLSRLLENDAQLPRKQASYCAQLQSALSSSDGFRRQATPLLLYRYFDGMAQTFKALRPLMKKGAPFALVVGTNHTILGGKRFDIDTPQHLADLASANGWTHIETIPLQTYQRYGYHMENAVTGEGLVIVRAS